MKSVLFWMLKYLGIPAGFMLATGIPQTIYTWSHQPQISSDDSFTPNEFATLEVTPENFFQYSDSLIKLRKQEIAVKGIYEPMNYFHDWKQFCMFREKYVDSLGEHRESVNIVLAITNTTNTLCGMRDEDWRKNDRVDRKGIDEARYFWFPKERERDLKSEKLTAEITWSSTFYWAVGWMSRFYLYGLPTAFILFLIWKFQTRKEFFAPASFLFSLIIWPIILGIDIRNRFNEFLKKADVVSRRNSLFTLFSKQEQQLLEFGKRMTNVEFGEHLDSLGMERKHSFASALCVTLFLIIIPASLFPQTTSVIHKEKVIIMKSDY